MGSKRKRIEELEQELRNAKAGHAFTTKDKLFWMDEAKRAYREANHATGKAAKAERALRSEGYEHSLLHNAWVKPAPAPLKHNVTRAVRPTDALRRSGTEQDWEVATNEAVRELLDKTADKDVVKSSLTIRRHQAEFAFEVPTVTASITERRGKDKVAGDRPSTCAEVYTNLLKAATLPHAVVIPNLG